MDEPRLDLLKQGVGSTKAIIFIHGAYSEEWGEKDKHYNRLLTSLQAAGWKDSVYHLWWDCSSAGWMHSNRVNLLKWAELKDRARKVGKKRFADLARYKVSEKEVSIVAYSLGVRVAYYALKEWSGYQHSLKDAIFLAGAVPRDSSKDWGEAASSLSGTLFNIYNNDDYALGYAVQSLYFGTSPCGLKPIKERHPRIMNLDATQDVGHHHGLSGYLACLPKHIEWNV